MRNISVQKQILLSEHFSTATGFSLCPPAQFKMRIDMLRENNARFALGLDPKADYRDYDCWLDPHGQTGFAVGHDNELTNVFSCGSTPGQGSEAVAFAKANYSALHLNCFAGPVEKFYLRHGFIESRRELNWEGASQPDIVYMHYRR